MIGNAGSERASPELPAGGLIRLAVAEDAPTLAAIEQAADALFDGVLTLPGRQLDAPSGNDFTDRPAGLGEFPRAGHGVRSGRGFTLVAVDAADAPVGFTLVAVDAADAPVGFTLVAVDATDAPVGFARVLELDARFHLDQLSVRPDWQRHGVGAALLTAVEAAVAARGASVVTLRTFAAPPWNATCYRRRGYAEVELPAAMAELLAAEERAGLLRAGPRVTLAKQVADHAVPVPAASVLPLRDAGSGVEVFVQYRSATMDFAAGAIVFPGGRVAPGEAAVAVPAGHEAAWRATALPAAGVLAAAAIREVAEECGVVLTAGDLVPWDDWVTPSGGRRRFDVAFYLTAARRGQLWRNRTTEAVDSRWRSPGDLLAEAAVGSVRLLPPTRRLLTELTAFRRVQDALAAGPAIVPVLHDQGAERFADPD